MNTVTEKMPINTFSITPGQLLTRAREARGLSQADISKQTRLSLQVVSDIEKDNYKNIGVRTFVRGYLCSFARIVGVSEKQILESFDASGLMPEVSYPVVSAIEGAPILNVTKQQLLFHTFSRGRYIRWVMVSSGILLLVGGIVWSQLSKTHPIKLPATPVASQTASIALAPQPVSQPTQQTAAVIKNNNIASVPVKTLPVVMPTSTVLKTPQKNMIKPAIKKTPVTTAIKKNSANGFVIKPQASIHTTYKISPVS